MFQALRTGISATICKEPAGVWRRFKLRPSAGANMHLMRAIVIAAGLAAMPATAHAVDLLTVPTSTNQSLPVADSGFDWNRFYAGVYGVGQSSGAAGGQFGGGVDLGINSRF